MVERVKVITAQLQLALQAEKANTLDSHYTGVMEV